MSNTSIKWFPCPFCGTKNMTSVYNSYGTTLSCEGCHGEFNFPAFEDEVKAMWIRNRKKPRQIEKLK